MAEIDPRRAAVMIDMQSVLIRGAVGEAANTKSIAHSSAAAAVAMRDGGVPHPYPISLPELATTTMPNPVVRRAAHCPHKRLSSVYQVAPSSSSFCSLV